MASITRRIKRDMVTGLWTRTERRVSDGRLTHAQGLQLVVNKTARRKSHFGVVETFPPRGRKYPALLGEKFG